MRIKIMAIFFLLFFISFPATAADNIVINEIAWMGSTASATDEWVELYNPAETEVDLTDWTLSWGKGDVLLSGAIPAKGYFLLERTDDDAVPEKTANQIYTGSLGNAGEDLILKNNLGATIDSALFSASWPAGDNTDKFTMERTCDLADGNLAESWQNSPQANGSPQAQNNCPVSTPNCTPIEINRICINENQASIVYSYNNPACGDDFAVEENDSSCTCNYTNWSDEECVENNLRKQTRTETTGYSYCQAELVREIEDLACPLETEKLIFFGKGCWFEHRKWRCDKNSQLAVSAENINITIPKNNFDKSFTIQNKREFRIFTILKTASENRRATVIINNKNNKITLFGSKLHFRGKID